MIIHLKGCSVGFQAIFSPCMWPDSADILFSHKWPEPPPPPRVVGWLVADPRTSALSQALGVQSMWMRCKLNSSPIQSSRHLLHTYPKPAHLLRPNPTPSNSMKLLSPQFKGASPTPSLQNSIIHPFKCIFTEHVPCDLVRQTWSRQRLQPVSVAPRTSTTHCDPSYSPHLAKSNGQFSILQQPPMVVRSLLSSGPLLGTEFWLPSTSTAIRRLLHILLCLLSYWQGVSSTSRQPWALPRSAPGLSILLPTTLQQPPNAPLLLPVWSPFSPAFWLCLM